MSPVQKVTLHPKGLYTNVNQLGAVPPGALSESKNVVLAKPGVLEVRRGRKTVAFFANYNNQSYYAGPRPLSLFNANLRVGGAYANNFLGTPTPGVIAMMSDGTMYWSPDGEKYTKVQPTYGFDPLLLGPIYGDRHWYGFEQNGSFYVATNQGVIKVGRPVPSGTGINYANPDPISLIDIRRAGYEPAGVPQGINTVAATGAVGTAMPTDSQVAYRFCFGERDANNIVHLGAPSTRAVVTNSTGQVRDIDLSTTIPPGIVAGIHFWQLYRSQPSSSATTDPGDNLGLVAEGAVPAPLVIDQMSRTGTTLTCRTTAAHGFAAPLPTVILNNGVTIPSADVSNQFFIARTNSTLRTIYKKTANAGSPTSIGTFSVTYEANYYSGVLALLDSDPTTGKIYYIEASSSKLYVLNADGTYNGVIDLGITVDFAVFDRAARSIKIIGRNTNTNALTFDYMNPNAVGSDRYWCAEWDAVTSTISYVNQGAPFRTFGNITSLTPANFAANARMGLWKAGPATEAFWAIAMQGYGQASQVAISNTKGITWGYLYTSPAHMDPLSHISTITANDTYSDGTQTYFAFATYGIGAYTDQIQYQDAEIYYLKNDGNGNPILVKSQNTYNYLSDPNYAVATQANIFTSLRCNERNGFIDAVIQRAITFPPSAVTYEHRIIRFGAFWEPSSSGLALNYATTVTGIRTSYIQDSNAVSGSNGFLVSFSDGKQYLDSDGTSGGVSLADTNGIYPTCPGGIKGQPLSANAYVAPGTYAVLSVVNSTQFTISSVQSPQVDFGATTVNVQVLPTEIQYTDTVAPEFLGPYLYSSPAVEGALQMNNAPPLCRDAALFRTTGFYANITQNTNVQVTMLKLPVAGQKIFIGTSGAFVTAGAAEDIQGRVFKITAPAGQVTLSMAIQATILSLCRVVNVNWRTFDNILYPIGVGSTAYSTFFASSIHAADPVYFKHTTSGNVLLSGYFSPNEFYGEAVRQKNLLAYSKINQPDAVPSTNFLRIGSDSKEILRIFPSRDALFVFKEDGAFIVRGYGPPWQVDPFDLTLQLSLPDSLASLDNAVFGAFTRGVFKITDSNVELLSLPIQNLLDHRLAGDEQPQAANWSFGVGDIPDHKYILFMPEESQTNDYCEEAYVYDTFTNEWTEWYLPSRHTLLFRDKILLHAFQVECQSNYPGYGGTANGAYPAILLENRALTKEDFFDDYLWRYPLINGPYANSVAIIGYDSETNSMLIADENHGGAYISKWDVFNESAGPRYQIMPAEDGVPGQYIKLLNTPDWTAFGPLPTPATPVWMGVTKGIPHAWKFAQAFPESPAATNHFSEFVVSFREAYWTMLKATFEVPVEQGDPWPHTLPQEVLFLGYKHFGPLREESKNNYIRTYVPRQCQRGTTLTVGIDTGVCKTVLQSNGMFILLTQGPTSFQRR